MGNRVKVLVQGWIREEALCDSIVSVDITHEIVTYCSWRPGDLIQLESGGQSPEFFLSTKLNLSLSTLLSDVDTLSFKLTQVPGETLVHVLKYLGHHKGKEPDPLPCPIRSIHMAQIVTDKWDATYVDAMDKKTIFEIILAANYMGIQPLLHLGCAKISTLIKQLDQKEINRIIEEEERYRREQAQAPMTMDSDHEADNDADDDKDEDDEDEGDGNEAENVDAVENVDEAPDDDGDTASDGDDIRIMMRQLSGSPSRIQRRLSASILAMTDSLDVDHDETNVNLDATEIVRSSSAGI